MKVIFLSDLPDQKVRKDDVRDVADGFARNFLFPKKLAQPVTAELFAQVQHRHQQRERETQRSHAALEKTAQKLRGMTLEFTAKAHDGKLFGGIGAKQMVQELKKRSVAIELKQIALEHPVKTVGEHKVKVHVGEGIEAEVRVQVSAE